MVTEAIVLGLLLYGQAHPFASPGGILTGGADPTIVAVSGEPGGYYDVQNLRAQRVLQIRPLTWTQDGWPRVGEPTFEPPARPLRSVIKG